MHTHAREQPCELGSPPLSVSGVQVVRLAPQMLSQLSRLLEPRITISFNVCLYH